MKEIFIIKETSYGYHDRYWAKTGIIEQWVVDIEQAIRFETYPAALSKLETLVRAGEFYSIEKHFIKA